MSYRRKSESAEELRDHKTFCRNNFNLVEATGLPLSLVEDYDAFNYFLMHGALWNGSPVQITLDGFTQEQRQAYLLLVKKYFQAGFSNPGLCGLTQYELDSLKGTHK